MDWSKGYKAQYYAMTVNPVTWEDEDRIELISGSINRDSTGLRGSAEFTSDASGFIERLIRIYVDAVQNEDIEHVPIFTGYAVSPTLDVSGTIQTQKYTCYSVLKPANDILLERGWYATLNANSGAIIRELLSATKVPFIIQGEPKCLERYIVAEEGETRLTMIDKIIRATGWSLVIDGRGEVILKPKEKEAKAVFAPNSNDIIEPDFSITHDWYNVPNVLRVVMDDVSATVRDDKETSIYSTVNRGREIWAEETNSELVAGDTLAQYASRRLKEQQTVGTEASYTRRFMPEINVGDIVQLRYDILNGKYIIANQKISLGHNLTTSENVEQLDTDIIIK